MNAAGAVSGTDRPVTVISPAGTGKTTVLKVARETLHRQGAQMVMVAPTKKALSVASGETGATASSLHGLLHDHGWRWGENPVGKTIWTRLNPGQVDAATGVLHEGSTKYVVQAGDRILIDEAGMVDLEAAHALAVLAAETGIGIAMVEDHLQALPVGHSGAMALMKQHSSPWSSSVLCTVLPTPTGLSLSLRLREPESEADAADIARALVDGGYVALDANDQEAREHMVDAWFTAHGKRESIALVIATHAEA